MKWRSNSLLSVVAAVSMASVAVVSCKPPVDEPNPEDPNAFAGTTNVVFVQREYQQKEMTFRISESNEVQRLLAAIRLENKQLCNCSHSFEAIFQKPSGEVRVSFCNHCFDVLSAQNRQSYKGRRFYKMPMAFYEEFREFARTRASEKWEIPPYFAP